MDLEQAVKNRLPIKAVTEGGDRLVSHIHVDTAVPRVVWAEKDWLTNQDTFGVHLIDGRVTGNGPWRVGDVKFEMFDDDDDYVLVMAYVNMLNEEDAEGHDYTAAVIALSQAI